MLSPHLHVCRAALDDAQTNHGSQCAPLPRSLLSLFVFFSSFLHTPFQTLNSSFSFALGPISTQAQQPEGQSKERKGPACGSVAGSPRARRRPTNLFVIEPPSRPGVAHSLTPLTHCTAHRITSSIRILHLSHLRSSASPDHCDPPPASASRCSAASTALPRFVCHATALVCKHSFVTTLYP